MAGTVSAETQKLQKLAVAATMQAVKQNCEFFVERYCYIEDRDSDSLAVPFKLWDNQRDGLETMLKNRLVVALKARQLGFTWLVLCRALWLMLKPGRSVLALSRTEEDAKELVRRIVFVLRYLPDWMMRGKENQIKGMMWYDNTASSVVIHHPDGEDATFKSFPASPNAGRSFTGNLLIIDEWAFQDYARDIWTAAYPTISRPTGGQFVGISTMSQGSLFSEIAQGALNGTNRFKLIFWPWNTDPRRDTVWYKDQQNTLGDAVFYEYPATVEDAFRVPGGTFFHEFAESVHVRPKLPEIPSHYQRFASIDYGLDALAVLWYYKDPWGSVRIYRELYDHDKTIPQAAEMILAAMAGEALDAFYAPGDLFGRRQDTGKSLAESFAGYGIYLSKADNRRKEGWEAVKELLRPRQEPNVQTEELQTVATLTIDEGAAPNLVRCLRSAQRDKNNVNVVAERPHELTHLLDSLRYFATARAMPSSGATTVTDDDEPEDGGIGAFLDYGT